MLRYGCDRCADELCKLKHARIGAQKVAKQLFVIHLYNAKNKYYNLCMGIHTLIIVILVLGILMFVYMRKSIQQLSTTRMFCLFFVLSMLNILIEMLEYWVFGYPAGFFPWLKEFSRGLYLILLLSVIYALSLYTFSRFTKERGVSRRHAVLSAIPAIVCAVLVALSKFVFGGTSSDILLNICYIIGLLYAVSSAVLAIVYNGRADREVFGAILVTHLIWCATFIIQLCRKGTQVSSLAMAATALIVYVSVENPKDYYETNMPAIRNKDALIAMLAESFAANKPFHIMSVIFIEKNILFTDSAKKALEDVQNKVAEFACSDYQLHAYLSSWNTLSFITKKADVVERFMSAINSYNSGGALNYKLRFSVIEAPAVVKELDKAMQLLSYVSGEYVYTQNSQDIVVDEEVVDKMIYRNTIEDVVRQAVKDKSFDVYYQPILSVKEGSFSSAEALVRLKRKDGEKYISPEDFIPIAEKCGLVQEIDDLVFEKVCSFISRENLMSYGLKTIEVNLSGNDAVDAHTHERLFRKMEKYHIPPNYINFEITDTSHITKDETFKENIRKMREQGFTFSMDDFGTGDSNLLELLKMDYVLIKMDREFVWNCLDPDKPDKLNVLKHTIDFIRKNGLHVLAEGVETLEQAKVLIDNGVEYLQGFYYSRPVPEDEYIEFLNAQKGLVNKTNEA